MTPATSLTSNVTTAQSTLQPTALKLVVVRPRLLFPQDCGANIHSAQLLKRLSRDHAVTLVTTMRTDEDEAAAETAAFCENLITVPVRKTLSERDAARAMARTVAGIYKTLHPHALVCDGVYACEALRLIEKPAYILFQHHAEAPVLRQRATHARSLVDKVKFGWQAWRMKSFEEKQCREALRVIAVSDADRLYFEREYGAPRCEIAAAGVDTEFFRPAPQAARINNIVFTGSLDWPANQEAVEYFVEHILPLIQKQSPNVMFSIVGRHAPERILKLGERPGINVTDAVNDVRPYVHHSKVYVAPIRASGGTRMSVLQAMAMGKAIVTTPAGAEGLMAEHGRHLLIADSPEDFARETISLLRDDVRRRMLELNARSLVERTHTWRQTAQEFSEICSRAVSRPH